MNGTDNVLAVNIPEAARRLGVSPRTVATLVSRKELASRKIGRRRVIPVSTLDAFLRHDHPTRTAGTERDVRRDGAYQIAPGKGHKQREAKV